MTQQRLRILFETLTQRQLSPGEEQELSALWEDPSNEVLAKELLEKWYDRVPALYSQAPEDAERVFRAVLGNRQLEDGGAERQETKGKVRRMRTFWWAAAVVVLLLAGGGYLMLHNNDPVPEGIVKAPLIAPGKEGAVLTLADGSTILLDTLADGMVATQGGTAVSLAGGKLSYEAGERAVPVMNRITTPRGRFFRLVLPDGSKVWLNAASSIQYPTAFSGAERRVKVAGEAYFEVVHHKAVPFRVELGTGVVEVLGTQFNVNDYKDEPAARVTLLEGSVKVERNSQVAVMKPGQQVILEPQLKVQQEVNTAQVIAWKEGGFNFDNMGVEAVMRQLSRWYDIEVVYKNGVPDKKFYGEIGRDLSLEEVLEGLKLSGVHFRIEANRKLIVLP